MKRLIKFVGAMGIAATLMLSSVSYAGEAYDSSQGISGSSNRAAEEATQPFDYNRLNGPGERARDDAGRGFDTNRDSNLGWGNQYIPTPTPKIDRDSGR